MWGFWLDLRLCLFKRLRFGSGRSAFSLLLRSITISLQHQLFRIDILGHLANELAELGLTNISLIRSRHGWWRLMITDPSLRCRFIQLVILGRVFFGDPLTRAWPSLGTHHRTLSFHLLKPSFFVLLLVAWVLLFLHVHHGWKASVACWEAVSPMDGGLCAVLPGHLLVMRLVLGWYLMP